MLVDSYRVEVQSSATGKWKISRRFYPHYKWCRVTRCILLRVLKWTQREIAGDPQIRAYDPDWAPALIVKNNAHRHARYILRTKCPRHFQHVRITRFEREGSQLVKCVIWQDGNWYENV